MDTDTAVEIANLKKDVSTLRRDHNKVEERFARAYEEMTEAVMGIRTDFKVVKWAFIFLIVGIGIGLGYLGIETLLKLVT